MKYDADLYLERQVRSDDAHGSVLCRIQIDARHLLLTGLTDDKLGDSALSIARAALPDLVHHLGRKPWPAAG